MPLFTRPTVLPVWATDDQVDPVSQSNNVLTPPPQLQQYGWPRGAFPPRNFFNWLGRQTYLCLAYLMQQAGFSTTTSNNTGTVPLVDVVNGGIATITIVDTDPASTALFYQGTVYVPPGYSSGTLTFNSIASASLSPSVIAANGGVTASGGIGPYVISVQMQVPS